jgi:hypothetical protein
MSDVPLYLFAVGCRGLVVLLPRCAPRYLFASQVKIIRFGGLNMFFGEGYAPYYWFIGELCPILF